MVYVRKKKEKTEFLPDFKVLMLYTVVTIDFVERLNCNDLSIQRVGF